MKRAVIPCAAFEGELRAATTRVRFWREEDRKPLGYFIPNAVDPELPLNATDTDPVVLFHEKPDLAGAADAKCTETYGGLTEFTELRAANGEVVGHFVPETERDLAHAEEAQRAFAEEGELTFADFDRTGSVSLEEFCKTVFGRELPVRG